MNKHKMLLIIPFFMFALTACDEKNESGSTDNSSSAANSAVATQEKPKVQPKEAPKCDNCGTVISITSVAVKGNSTGAGGAIGAVVGGLLGNGVGDGKGKDVATIVGLVGGAVAGNEIEKQRNSVSYFDFLIGMEQGGERTMRLASTQGLGVGSAVKIVGNGLELR
ncbi:glycine zipper 2TM domain-containing protein [Neptunomonas antarctica]|uniref:Glycine zipper 2TM domain-containing protein n=1 Tax=Neptunomonas antarctica TaxID=619304 RepID=A0A1N7MVW1_9GAMM|nr:glycine zipper 2TM domain-containing protein [Neptunomonas antarctica]SIS90284.1 Glycine zipper 2TM domain-containing protein [Neptunomonas antarctica]